MILRLYRSTIHQPLDVASNKGFHEVMNLLWLLEKKGISNEVIDVDSLSEDDVQKAYLAAVVPSVFKKFRIRQVFGSRRRSGWLFGRGVPALLVYEEGEQRPSDVYPHEEGQGRVKPIREFLYDLQTDLLLKVREQ